MYHWKVQNLEGRIRLCEREGKETKYLQKELNDYRDSVDFDTETEPEVDISWIYSFEKSSTKTKSKTNSKTKSK